MPKIIVSRARTRELLTQKPVTAKELAAEFDWDDHLCASLLRRMHVDKEAHIGSWKVPLSGRTVPVYHGGPGDDAPRPENLTNAERARRGRARREWGAKASAIDAQLARRRALLQDNYDLQMAEINRSLGVINARKAKYDEAFENAVLNLTASAAAAKRALDRKAPAAVKKSAPAAKPAKVPPTPRPAPSAVPPLSILGQLQGAHK